MTPGQMYIYKGTKSRTGSSVDKAGLTNGGLYGIEVDGVADDSRNAVIRRARTSAASRSAMSAARRPRNSRRRATPPA
jgi:hypothetical protein